MLPANPCKLCADYLESFPNGGLHDFLIYLINSKLPQPDFTTVFLVREMQTYKFN